jgi:hypothetical protein
MTTAKSDINLMRVFQSDKESGSEIRFVASPTRRGRPITVPPASPRTIVRVDSVLRARRGIAPHDLSYGRKVCINFEGTSIAASCAPRPSPVRRAAISTPN